MSDPGSGPISYLAIADGTPVHSADGASIGTVEHVLQDDALDLFDGLVVRTSAGRRFVDAGRITSITAVAVATSLTDDDAAHLPEPDGAAVFDADPHEFEGTGLSRWFGRMFRREHWMRETGDDPGER
jgi:hypothetical protein